MSSASFLKINERIHAGGRELLDGFTAIDFVGLTEEEKSELSARFRGWFAFNWLRHLETDASYKEFVAESAKTVVDTSKHYVDTLIAATELGVATEPLKNLLVAFDKLDSISRMKVINFYAQRSLPEGEHGAYLDFLVKTIRSAPGDRIFAAVALLKRLGRIPKTQEFIEACQKLESGDPATREAALQELLPESACIRQAEVPEKKRSWFKFK